MNKYVVLSDDIHVNNLRLFLLLLAITIFAAGCGPPINGDCSCNVPPVTAPQNVQVVAGDEQITISWDDAENAWSYIIYWNTTGGVIISDAEIFGIFSPYTHAGLINGTTYYYIVTAFNEGPVAASSVEVSATPMVASVLPD